MPCSALLSPVRLWARWTLGLCGSSWNLSLPGHICVSCFGCPPAGEAWQETWADRVAAVSAPALWTQRLQLCKAHCIVVLFVELAGSVLQRPSACPVPQQGTWWRAGRVQAHVVLLRGAAWATARCRGVSVLRAGAACGLQRTCHAVVSLPCVSMLALSMRARRAAQSGFWSAPGMSAHQE